MIRYIYILLLLSLFATIWGQDCVDGVEVELWGVCYSIEGTTTLYLQNSGLTGEIPSEIGNLTNLIQLRLYDNQLTGEIPSEIRNLSNLTNLYLYNNQLTGEIPQEVCDLIENNDWDSWWNFETHILEGNDDLINTCDD